jgi:hypothetical protein
MEEFGSAKWTSSPARAELEEITRKVESGFRVNFNQFVVNLTPLQADNTRSVRATLLTVSVIAAIAGLGSGVVGSLMLGRALEALLYGVQPGDRGLVELVELVELSVISVSI